MTRYTHTLRGQKAKAIEALPKIEITKHSQVKTGTDDVPENLTANLTKNYVKTHKNTVKSSKGGSCGHDSPKNVKSIKNNKLKDLSQPRPAGIEPATFGFEVPNTAHKRSNDKYLNPVFLRQNEVCKWLASEQIKNICF